MFLRKNPRHIKSDSSIYIIIGNRTINQIIFFSAIHTPKEIEKNSLEEYVIKLVRKKCLDYAELSVKESFLTLDRDSYEFRTLLQSFIDQVEVYPENIVVKLFVKGNVKSFRHNRRAFKTPSQRCFKDKK